MTSAIAVKSLKRTSLFRDASVRVLADLVHRSRRMRIEHGVNERTAIVVVLEGALDVRTEGLPQAAQPSRRVERTQPIALAHLIAGDTYAPDVSAIADPMLHLEPTSPQGADVILLDGALLRAAARASFSLARTLRVYDADASLLTFPEDEKPPPPAHLVWLCMDPRLDAPLEPLGQLLAASIGREHGEATVLLNLDAKTLELRDRETGSIVRADFPLAGAGDEKRILDAVVGAIGAARGGPYHIVVICPLKPNSLTPGFHALTFHHIVYVTPIVPTRIPGNLERQLRPEARNRESPSDAYFTSFIPSIVSRRDARGGPFAGLSAAAATCLRSLGRSLGWSGSFRTEELELHRVTRVNRERVGWRLARDACRLRFDLTDLKRRWERWNRDAASFPAVTFADSLPYQAAAERWARAVTNRRVGLALSGGGASSYRMVPFIKRLRQLHVPIDVVSGVSGGALLGAYYCKDPVDGLDQCVRYGPFFQLVFFASVINSFAIELALDFTLGGTDVADVDVDFVPVTTALPEGEPPEMHVVTHATLGEAVRMSGAAPVLVGPVHRGRTRYSDGGSATMLPAAVLERYGADIVFACNSIPPPADGNPLGALPGGRWIRWFTPVGRVLDGWASGAFLMERVAEEAGDDADVYVETHRQQTPLLEQAAFFLAPCLAASAARDDLLEAAAQRCRDRWLTSP